MSYPIEEAAKESLSAVRRPTLRENLEMRKKRLTEQLSEVENAIQTLDENPAFEKCHEAIVRAGY